mmetsp:Transcript_25053/g.50893  ORF Transcript_25053/g.50893 Transcript_25053/m.50893 type:complete len:222 (-) Transcript_25053:437-1102(-)
MLRIGRRTSRAPSTSSTLPTTSRRRLLSGSLEARPSRPSMLTLMPWATLATEIPPPGRNLAPSSTRWRSTCWWNGNPWRRNSGTSSRRDQRSPLSTPTRRSSCVSRTTWKPASFTPTRATLSPSSRSSSPKCKSGCWTRTLLPLRMPIARPSARTTCSSRRSRKCARHRINASVQAEPRQLLALPHFPEVRTTLVLALLLLLLRTSSRCWLTWATTGTAPR